MDGLLKQILILFGLVFLIVIMLVVYIILRSMGLR